MGMVPAVTYKAADTEKERSGGGFQGTDIVAMNGKAARVTAGTGKPVELQLCNKIIIKIWR